MALTELLATHLQLLYATKRDLGDYVAHWSERISSPQLLTHLRQAMTDYDKQLTIVEQCLTDIGAKPAHEFHSPLVTAYSGADHGLTLRLAHLAPEEFDAFFVMNLTQIINVELAMFRGIQTMARAIGRDRIFTLLDEAHIRSERELSQLQEQFRALIQQAAERRKAA